MSDFKYRRAEAVPKTDNSLYMNGSMTAGNSKDEKNNFSDILKNEMANKNESVSGIDVNFIITMLDSGLNLSDISDALGIELAVLTTFIYNDVKRFDPDSYIEITSIINRRLFERDRKR